MSSLWGDDFTIQPQKVDSKEVLKKISTPKKAKTVVKNVLASKTVSDAEKLKVIEDNVNRILGVYKENTIVLNTIEELSQYIDASISNNIIAVDTETNNSLDPLTCKLMGLCLYTPGQKNAYIPVNHINAQTGERLTNQVFEHQIKEQLDRLNETKIIMHNGKFDYQVLKCTCDVKLNIYWDTLIGARLLDENELAGLKEQYISKIDPSIEKYSIDHLFKIDYAVVPPELFALYAATDSFMTYKLYEYQKSQFLLPTNERLFKLFKNVEMPVVEVLAEMELTGVCIDTDYAKRLSVKYNKKLAEVDNELEKVLKQYDNLIAEWRQTPEATHKALSSKPNKNGEYTLQKSKSEQLGNPINLGSPTQLAILLYDVLKTPPVDKRSPRGTGEAILEKINLPICKIILERRGLVKFINTYIDKIPECINSSTHRLHCKFNQVEAKTGRQSSSDPNLQNIPSHDNAIRMMFIPSPGCTFVGSDYSQQEPRLLAQYSGDENMINSYVEGKDLYAVVASQVYHNNYEDNKEFYPDGTMNPEGKKRRTNMKSLLLGIMYGRGVVSIAEQIKTHDGDTTQEDIKEAQEIQNGFFKSFPKVKNWVDKTQTDGHKFGYVEDLWGRKRRLPDLMLPTYTIKSINSTGDFNPLLGCKGLVSALDNDVIKDYTNKMAKARGVKEREAVKNAALQNGIKIVDNTGFISQAERQCVNARIQGGAASMTKVALRKIYDCQELKDLSFKLLLSVHDEIIGECPVQHADRVKELLSNLMIEAAKPECQVPMKCDADDFPAWYYDVYTADLEAEYKKLCSSNTKEEAFKIIVDNHEECTYNQLQDMLKAYL